MIEPMLLKSCKEKSLKKYEGTHIAQEKFDGTRIIVVKENNKISMQTRSGKNDLASEYPDIVKELLATTQTSFILDGELVFVNKKTGCVEFLTGLAKETREAYEPKLMLFDVLEFQKFNQRHLSQVERTAWIEKFVASYNFKHVYAIFTILDNFDGSYQQVIDGGGEGLVLKKKTATYKDGKRSSDWLKVKKQDTADCFIVGMMEGDGKYAHQFGSLILAQYNKDSTVMVVCNCSGFTDQQRTDFYDMLIKEPWVETFPSTKGELTHIVHKVAPKVVVEIEFMERLESGSVRHPRFLRIRTDKLPKDCVYGGE
jgi:bifunctional non-homologous end joining protein LigD